MAIMQPIVPRCHIPWQQMIIDSTGAVAPCCYWGAYDNLNSPVGNVKEQSIEEIWNSEPYQKLRAGMAKGDLKAAGCAKCYAVKQGMALGFEYDNDADGDTETPHGRNLVVLKTEIAEGATVLEAKPTIISYIPSHRCNIRCTHCYQESTREAEINRADAAEEIERLAPYLVRIVAGGGEPFLLPIWRRFLANFDVRKNPYLDFSTSTNATIVSESILEGLRRFKTMTINVSVDGTGEAYERVRLGAKFDVVRANIRRIKEVMKASPSPKANVGISMCVMKSNIHDLPNLVRFARDEVLQFSMSPVVTLPPDESLRCFNDPVLDMAGWGEAIDAAKAEVESFFPSLAVIWRIQNVPDEAKAVWRDLFELLRAQIPLDLVNVPHRRVTVSIPEAQLARGIAKHGAVPLVARIYPKGSAGGVSYWGPVRSGCCEVSLPDGDFSISLGTKWAEMSDDGESIFRVSQLDNVPIVVRRYERYAPRRVAVGVIRRARRLLDRVTA